MQPRVETLTGIKLIGMRIIMSFSDNRTRELWTSFMPRKREITNSIGIELYSVEIYPPGFFTKFNPMAVFEKWAATGVTDFGSIPAGMEQLSLPEGLYAVFLHKGSAATGPETYKYIFNTWMPESAYIVDDRPHFAVMGEKYKNDDPDSEEEIWIPVRLKSEAGINANKRVISI